MINYLLDNPEVMQSIETGVAVTTVLLLLVSSLIIVKS